MSKIFFRFLVDVVGEESDNVQIYIIVSEEDIMDTSPERASLPDLPPETQPLCPVCGALLSPRGELLHCLRCRFTWCQSCDGDTRFPESSKARLWA